MVSIDEGRKVFQAVEVSPGGKPVVTGWKLGKIVQRSHFVMERPDGVFAVSNKQRDHFALVNVVSQRLNITSEPCVADNDACSVRCAQGFQLHTEPPTEQSPT